MSFVGVVGPVEDPKTVRELAGKRRDAVGSRISDRSYPDGKMDRQSYPSSGSDALL